MSRRSKGNRKLAAAVALVERDGPTCAACGRFVLFPFQVWDLPGWVFTERQAIYQGVRICRRATLDHVTPSSQWDGDEYDPRNLRIACGHCNHRRGDAAIEGQS